MSGAIWGHGAHCHVLARSLCRHQTMVQGSTWQRAGLAVPMLGWPTLRPRTSFR